MNTHSLPGRTVQIDGQERLYFSGTSYLGINHCEAYKQLLMEGIQQYGGNYSSSRSSNLQLAVYEEAEHFLSKRLGQEAVLTFSSGYQAGQALMNALPRDAHYIFAPKTHPAVWQTNQKIWSGSFPSWVLSLPTQLSSTPTEEVIIVTNSLDPLFAEKYKFNWLADLPSDKNIHVVIDDSHGLGVLGEKGEGIIKEVKPFLPQHIQLTIVGSIGKALGIPGGIVAGSKDLIRQLKKSPFFTAASPIPPAYLYAFLRAQSLYQEARIRLKQRVVQFQQQIKESGLFTYFDHYPIFYTPHNTLSKAVEDSCVLSSFPYPNPDSEPVTRVVLSVLHREEDINTLATTTLAHIHSIKI
ncbi:aminotransferase class I/II-fold pyridoxal phosphate-dependent enzyme [Catalinimonas niigatensis]|uniref:aminotransferase class I/II-fold pyridoxal phosphate-dependent enzyme n=1 Tax=Catalinimonas niigatensis TaxID=1397264 RepID=UPI002666C2EE|nr:aminotransferase class I/II-fold pyridoxal phosphate-dependent enzyme [Catalinimonas niigatensis]WPP48270.1 aminotransferase class I/II-fold pyridoxal phosphate-dependent enzyme [Catalinimonas niigatensis]